MTPEEYKMILVGAITKSQVGKETDRMVELLEKFKQVKWEQWCDGCEHYARKPLDFECHPCRRRFPDHYTPKQEAK